MSQEISVATINLHNRADRWRQRRHLLVAQLVDSTPDLISLQEISYSIGQARWLRNQINARLPEGKRPYALVQKRRQHWYKFSEGVGILSNLPIVYDDFVNLGQGGYVGLRANIELPNRRTFDFVATYLHHSSHDVETRHEQTLLLLGWLRSQRPLAHQIVAGDFNEIPSGLAIKAMKQTFRSAYEEVYGREPLATFPTNLSTRTDGWSGCLDYIFVTPAIESVLQAGIFCDQPADDDESLYPSDHVGLLVRLQI